jgi:pyridoxal 5'-phosphate synthase pdxS subunit
MGKGEGAKNKTSRQATTGTADVKIGMAKMLKGGVIMDVVDAEQARIVSNQCRPQTTRALRKNALAELGRPTARRRRARAESESAKDAPRLIEPSERSTQTQSRAQAEAAGAVAVMALERIPADIRADGGVARMSDPQMIEGIKKAVTIPVMAKARIGHFVEAQVLEAAEVDYIDESEVLTMADEDNHINKNKFTVPFVCGCRNLGEALRRVAEGASMLRTKGEAGTGNVVEAVRHARTVQKQIKMLTTMDEDELFVAAKEMQAPYELVKQVAEEGRLPVVNFAAGGVATPADAALMMQLGMDGVFVGSGIFKSEDPTKRAKAIVRAVAHYSDPKVLLETSTNLGKAMVGISDVKGDAVNFRDREGGAKEATGEGIPKKRKLHGHTETQLYGSSWK